jgi:hypothetical protein
MMNTKLLEIQTCLDFHFNCYAIQDMSATSAATGFHRFFTNSTHTTFVSFKQRHQVFSILHLVCGSATADGRDTQWDLLAHNGGKCGVNARSCIRMTCRNTSAIYVSFDSLKHIEKRIRANKRFFQALQREFIMLIMNIFNSKLTSKWQHRIMTALLSLRASTYLITQEQL